MKSHQYDYRPEDLLKTLGLPAMACLLFAVMARLFTLLPFAPAPRPALDVDRAVMIQQIDSSAQSPPADWVLIGDSSCLMNLDAAQFTKLSGQQVINLGTLSFLNLETFSQLLAHYLSSHEQTPSKIVLLTHPDFVRKSSTSTAHTGAFEHYLQQTDHAYVANAGWSPRSWLGLPIVEGRLLGRLPIPLTGSFRDYYGFTTDLMRFMQAHQGSAVDPRTLQEDDLQGSSDYRVAKIHSRTAASLKAVIPGQTRFYVGLTPLPQDFVDRDFTEEYQALLADWVALFPGSIPLTELPPTLDKQHFATKTHLTEQAAKNYTQLLHEHLTSIGLQ